MDQREEALKQWLSTLFPATTLTLSPLAGDASFRRYFRLNLGQKSYIALDAPPDKEPSDAVVATTKLFQTIGLNVPQIFHMDLKNGFLLLDDFGDALYFTELNNHNADKLYGTAIEALLTLQENLSQANIACFNDQLLSQELHYFTEWFLEKYLVLSPDHTVLKNCYDTLFQNAIEQPVVLIHRDYHSKNLMWLPSSETGVLDFQDAMRGPITYDLVSLLRDCYIDWPSDKVTQWVDLYYQKAYQKNLLKCDKKAFFRWFDLMGMQRHLKATFIFARKFLRDQNDSYLQYIPRTLNYVTNVCGQYPELQPFEQLLQETILPAWQKKWDRQ